MRAVPAKSGRTPTVTTTLFSRGVNGRNFSGTKDVAIGPLYGA